MLTILAIIAVITGVYVWKRSAIRLPPTEQSAIQQSLKTGATILDVRTRSEFASGHVEGAINVPLRELPVSLGKLGPKKQQLVVYCRSGSRSGNAVSFLRQRGFNALDMKAMSNWAHVRPM